jgi:hypothetical protein
MERDEHSTTEKLGSWSYATNNSYHQIAHSARLVAYWDICGEVTLVPLRLPEREPHGHQ